MGDYHPNSTLDLLSHQVEFEWPGEHEATLQPRSLCFLGPQNRQSPSAGLETSRVAHNSTFLRRTVLSSSVLPRRGVALIDSYDEVSIGRDRCKTPRLRLKEPAVSKYHANIYWDSHIQLWSLVDIGSTHGTNLVSPESPEAQLSGSISSLGYHLNKSTRLSPPKMSSLSRPLSRLQHIVIGGATLVVHIHLD
ncbi:hypothetical protein FS749_002062 [Ceratobasidium sp. UAMH 11750]|nr:hypothetical protein FS749_002062 [Ceratobasidium sp. UAMH 11750]